MSHPLEDAMDNLVVAVKSWSSLAEEIEQAQMENRVYPNAEERTAEGLLDTCRALDAALLQYGKLQEGDLADNKVEQVVTYVTEIAVRVQGVVGHLYIERQVFMGNAERLNEAMAMEAIRVHAKAKKKASK